MDFDVTINSDNKSHRVPISVRGVLCDLVLDVHVFLDNPWEMFQVFGSVGKSWKAPH